MLNHNFLICAKGEIWALTVCIVVNGEKFHAVTLTLIRQCPMSNSSELFSYTTISLKSIKPLFFELSCTQTHRHTDRQTPRQTDGRTDRQTDRHTDGHEYSIFAVDKPQL